MTNANRELDPEPVNCESHPDSLIPQTSIFKMLLKVQGVRFSKVKGKVMANVV